MSHVVSEVPLDVLGRSSSLREGGELIRQLRPDLAIAEIAAAAVRARRLARTHRPRHGKETVVAARHGRKTLAARGFEPASI